MTPSPHSVFIHVFKPLGNLALVAALLAAPTAFTDDDLPARAEASLRRALAAIETLERSGGWGMAWTEDGALMWGEHRPRPRTWITVQPPATPGIATVFLDAGRVLKDEPYLARAKKARDALLAIQTQAGGFPHEAEPGAPHVIPGTIDDNTTTGALDFFIALWRVTRDDTDRQAVLSVGEFLLKAQYPDSGGWPQMYPPLKTTYHRHITFNDNAMADVMKSLLELHALTGDRRYLDAAIRGGDCILKLQGGPGEEIWAAQYDPDTLEPAWARFFEPPSYSSAESVGICNILIELYLVTGEQRFLEPLPKAFAWYEASRLPNGNWARFYEYKTRRPVYGRRDKPEPVYDLEKATSGYGWQSPNWYPHAAKAAYDRIAQVGRAAYAKERAKRDAAPTDIERLAQEARDVCASLDPTGFWFSSASAEEKATMAETPGFNTNQRIIHSGVFCRNANTLLEYLEAKKSPVADKERS